ncbi:acyl-CoA dehydrogenase family protein [uncultured Sphingomonas sp.]|uniref:acyl-CoA dehydrogenase family protein n=1 Tax=uncultured Sphingomonas sp. TaxID=158754 RepID=UPI0035C9606B
MSEEREQLREALTRRLVGESDDGRTWAALRDMGVLGLRIPETLGGLGLSVSEVEPVFDVIGEHRLPVGYLDTAVIAAGLLQVDRSPAADDLLRAIATDGARVAVAGIDRRLRGAVSATPTATGWRLDGDAKLVIGSAEAAWIIVAARTEWYATALLLVAAGTAGMTSHDYATIDGRSASDLRFIGAEATLLTPDAHEALTTANDEAIACLSVEAAALMRRLVADTVSYAKTREQFGQPIAGFQVVQHRLVDMHIQARRAGAIARRAMAAIDGRWLERGRLASAAKATAAQAGRFVGQQAVQLHGGMGMTEDLPIGRYFKRLTAIETELGGLDEHRQRFAKLTIEEAA